MKKFLWIWTVWIAVASAIYAAIYLHTPLAGYGIIWMTFVALPIYFSTGAQLKEFPNYFCSLWVGLGWGIVNLWVIDAFMGVGVPAAWANVIDLATVTIPCVGLHMIVLGKTWLNKVPIIFGALAMTFSTGGQNMLAVGLTMTGGLILGVAISTVGDWLQKKLKVTS